MMISLQSHYPLSLSMERHNVLEYSAVCERNRTTTKRPGHLVRRLQWSARHTTAPHSPSSHRTSWRTPRRPLSMLGSWLFGAGAGVLICRYARTLVSFVTIFQCFPYMHTRQSLYCTVTVYVHINNAAPGRAYHLPLRSKSCPPGC